MVQGKLRAARVATVLAAILVLSAVMRAESTDCGSPVVIVPDGRITQSVFPQKTTLWYGIYAQAGHSYAIEFVPAADNQLDTDKVLFASLNVFSPNDNLTGCRGSSSLNVTLNSGYAPAILKNGNGAGRRVSFVAQNAGLHLIAVSNNAMGGDYSFSAYDTTMFNVRWSTAGGYSDQWGFLNRSDMTITGTFSLYNLNNQVVASVQVTIPPGGEVVRYSSPSDLNLPTNSSGYAVFGHNGPPGALIGDTYMINQAGTLIIYSKFEGGGTLR